MTNGFEFEVVDDIIVIKFVVVFVVEVFVVIFIVVVDGSDVELLVCSGCVGEDAISAIEDVVVCFAPVVNVEVASLVGSFVVVKLVRDVADVVILVVVVTCGDVSSSCILHSMLEI